MRRWLRVGSWTVAALSLSYFGFVAWLGIHQLEGLEAIASGKALAATTLLAFSWVVFLESYWARILNDSVVTTIPSRASVRWTFAKSYLARYAPGKVWPIVIRTADLGSQGVHWRDTARATLIEQIGFMVGSALTLLATIALISAILTNTHAYLIALGTLLAGVLAWLVFHFLSSDPLTALVSNQLKRLTDRISSGSAEGIRLPSRAEWAQAILLGTLLAFTQSISALPLVLEFAPDSGILVIMVACLAYPAARWIGQLVGVSPGGLGVREGAFVAFLAPILPASTTLLIALWLRGATMLAEALFLAVAALARLARREVDR